MKQLFIFCCLMLAVSFVKSQTPYYVVFDLAGKDTMEQRAVIRWLNEISIPHPEAKLEVVMYAKGVEFVIQNKTIYADAISKLMENKNISFNVCAIALKNQNYTKDQLLPGVGVVPDGIYEIISKQAQGWGYIKVAL